MNVGKLVFAQVMEHLPMTTFRRCVARYGGEREVKTFSCLDQYLSMAFAQLPAQGKRVSIPGLSGCCRVLRRGIEATAAHVPVPAVITAANAFSFDPASHQRGAAMRA